MSLVNSATTMGCLGAACLLFLQHLRYKKLKQKCAPEEAEDLYVGVDIGGTTVSLGIVDSTGTVLAGSCQEVLDKAPSGVVKLIVQQLDDCVERLKLTSRDRIKSLGIGVPGIINTKTGVVLVCANYSWENVPIVSMVRAATGSIPAVLENDANVAMLGECWIGASKGVPNVVMLTLGTGIGGAILIDGKLVRGATGSAGEFGHMIAVPGGKLSSSTGVHGVLEDYASARALAEEASHAGGVALTAKEAMTLAQGGDKRMEKCVDDVASHLALACVNIERIFDPNTIVLTGGLTLAGNYFLKKVQLHFERLNWSLHPHTSDIVFATTGNRAGMIGAAYCAYALDHSLEL